MARLSLSKPCTERSPCNRPRGGTRNCPVVAPSFGLAALKHDPEKCAAVFGKDHAQTRTWSGMPIQGKIPALVCARAQGPSSTAVRPSIGKTDERRRVGDRSEGRLDA